MAQHARVRPHTAPEQGHTAGATGTPRYTDTPGSISHNPFLMMRIFSWPCRQLWLRNTWKGPLVGRGSASSTIRPSASFLYIVPPSRLACRRRLPCRPACGTGTSLLDPWYRSRLVCVRRVCLMP
eukprot:4510426-Prymnesium_polylepis.1